MIKTAKIFLIAGLLVLSACASQPDITGDSSQLEMRKIQTREYEAVEKRSAMRSVVATLQDFGFVIDAADPDIGTVSATRLHQHTMRITVTVFERSDERIAVRANARIGEQSVTDAKTYQDFFVALDKSLFLTANQVD